MTTGADPFIPATVGRIVFAVAPGEVVCVVQDQEERGASDPTDGGDEGAKAQAAAGSPVVDAQSADVQARTPRMAHPATHLAGGA